MKVSEQFNTQARHLTAHWLMVLALAALELVFWRLHSVLRLRQTSSVSRQFFAAVSAL